MEINVTQEDIDKGERRKAFNYPIALAIRGVYGSEAAVSVGGGWPDCLMMTYFYQISPENL